MTTALTWVIGEGGLLGSHVRRALRPRGDRLQPWTCPERPFAWKDRDRLRDQLGASVAAFEGEVRARGGSWAVLWCAGVGIVGADQSLLEIERLAFQWLLEFLGQGLAAPGQSVAGLVFFASSGGAVYGDCPDRPITEASSPRPISAYGRHKLALENLLSAWAAAHPAVATLIARISNLYGVGQGSQKPQGLISHLSRSLIFQQHINIYVSLDTIRDYYYAVDCARALTACIDHLLPTAGSAHPAPRVLKIFASEQTASIAQILGVFVTLTRFRPRFICHPGPASRIQPRNLQFRSTVLRDVVPTQRTDLLTGVKLVYLHNLSDYMRGLLRPHLSRPVKGTRSPS